MLDLPSGTVTFLFTDIEGSTERWERERAAMAQAVVRHLAVLDATIRDHGGVYFKTVGDAVQAGAAASVGQRSLIAEDWAAARGLRVRMPCTRATPPGRSRGLRRGFPDLAALAAVVAAPDPSATLRLHSETDP